MKKILMVALEFPPCHSSGVQRTYKFAEYLSQLGWEPLVLTADTDAYQHVEQDFKLPACLEGKVFRVPCVNLKKLFSINGKYPGIVEYFDKYWPWYFPAVKEGLKLIQDFKPDVIWSTYPVITAHLTAYRLAKSSGIPWVMDYRDPVRQHYDPSYTNANWLTFLLEKKMITCCAAAVFTTERAVNFYTDKYPQHANKFIKITNGYSSVPEPIYSVNDSNKFIFLHSGMLYEKDRDISSLIFAVAKLLKLKDLAEKNFIFRFRGASPSKNIKKLIEKLKLEVYFEFLPTISFNESINEMQRVKAFLLIQGGCLENQVPGKVYEYLKFRKPILAFCPKESATYDEIRCLSNVFFAETKDDVCDNIVMIMKNPEEYDYEIEKFSRLEKSRELNRLISRIVHLPADLKAGQPGTIKP